MRSKLAIPALVVACTFGTMAMASAQDSTTQPSKEAAAPTAKVKKHHKMAHHKVRPGTTTGMSTTGTSYGQGKARPGGSSVSSKPPGS